MFERLLFSRIPVWVLVLLIILAVPCIVLFGALVRSAALGFFPYGALNWTALAVAEAPATIKEVAQVRCKGDAPALRASEQRFPGQSGFVFATDAKPEDGFLLLSRYVGDRKQSVVELRDLAARRLLPSWVPDMAELEPLLQHASRIVDTARMNKPERIRLFHPLPMPDGGRVVQNTSPLIRLDACARPGLDAARHLPPFRRLRRGRGHLGLVASGAADGPACQADLHRGCGRARLCHGRGALLGLGAATSLRSRPWPADLGRRHPFRRSLAPERCRTGAEGRPLLEGRGPAAQPPQCLGGRALPSAEERIVWVRTGPWVNQHDVDVVDDSHFSVFDNHRFKGPGQFAWVEGANGVLVHDLATGQPPRPWGEAMAALEVRTVSEGLADLDPDGGVMIEETNYGRLLSLDAEGTLRWSYVNQASDDLVYHVSWSRLLSRAEGEALAAATAAAGCP
jgi:hypothetical protein